MSRRLRDLEQLAARIDRERSRALRVDLAPLAERGPLVFEIAVLLGTAYPVLVPTSDVQRAELGAIAAEGWVSPRTREGLIDALGAALATASDEAEFRSRLRRFARKERARVALRELLPRRLGGADVDVTARELAFLADATIEHAVREATAWAARRYGTAISTGGEPSGFVVLGMGKLGGEELNAGSDVDLVYFYDSDDGAVIPPGERAPRSGPDATSVHELWLRVARRVTSTLEEVTDDGSVWRVDLRLRPEGTAGPLVNSLAAAERYYESFGRLWERAAFLRARPVAGHLELGERLLESLGAFVWRKRIDPSIAVELAALVRRARAELAVDPERDLKLGPGGIREAEFFVQALQLVWGGREPSVRVRPTLAALGRLEAKGLCTGREADDISSAYLALRRAEHAVQTASGIQTHALPSGDDLERVARTLGFERTEAFLADLTRHRARVERRLRSLVPRSEGAAPPHEALLSALETLDPAVLTESLARANGDDPSDPSDGTCALARHLVELARHPDGLLGARTSEAFPGLAETLLDALLDAPDPVQAARYLRFFFARVRHPAVYVRLAFSDPAAMRRLIAILGASAFVGDALVNNPELGDLVLFSRDVPSAESAAREVQLAYDRHLAEARADVDPTEALVEALRLAKVRVTLQVALADLSGELDVRTVNHALTGLADASLACATKAALGNDDALGIAVLAMGKLGGRETSYGSDLDVVFVYDAARAPDPLEASSHFTRVARRIIRILTTFHGAGPAYELDTRLRPSGSQGLLVTSLESFARYHGVPLDDDGKNPLSKTAAWERMALLRARHAAGDRALGERALGIARRAALAAPIARDESALELRRIRERVERELSAERPGVYDVKLGRGGLLDIEFVVQFLQVCHGEALGEALWAQDTLEALEKLAEHQLLPDDAAKSLFDGWTFLRRLELRARVARTDGAHVVDARGPELGVLARRMGMRDRAGRTAEEELVGRLREITERVRAVFDEVVRRVESP